MFYDAETQLVQILPLCPAGLYEFSSAPPEIAPEAWKPENWQAHSTEDADAWTPDETAADIFSVGVLYMELIAGSTDWSALNHMLSTQSDFPETIIRCCCLLPALRPSISELLDLPAAEAKSHLPHFSSIRAAVPKSNLLGGLKQKLAGFQTLFEDEEDGFSDPQQHDSDNETR